jgi:dTDP-4-amino-4,6-dideoxy-D-galactose acyltransferase
MKVEQVSVAEATRRGHVDAAHLADNPQALTFVLESAEGPGLLQLEVSAFDSELFGGKSGRLVQLSAPDERGYAALLAAFTAECRKRSIAHVVRRAAVGAFAESWALAASGFRLVDVSVLFERSAEDVAPFQDPAVRLVRSEEVEALAEKFATAFTLTRFAVDPFCSEAAAAELHRRWIRNSCRGRADAVFVAEGLAGFVTCRVDAAQRTGGIELIAVDPAQRGGGYGGRLVSAALDWFRGKVDRVQVRTQLNNSVAVGLYQSRGLRLRLGEVTYSWMDGEKVVR